MENKITLTTNSSLSAQTTSGLKKRLFFFVFFTASVTQGMYSTYFVSILTTIERLYQIQSKTAGAIICATEIGQIFGALVIAYYGGKGNKPRWIAGCMTVMAFAGLLSTTPHFLFNSSTTTSPLGHDLINTKNSSNISPINLTLESSHPLIAQPTPIQEQLCYLSNSEPTVMNSTSIQAVNSITSVSLRQKPVGIILVIFFFSLLVIGFGSTAVTTLGIPFIDDIVTKEESPLYLSLSIGSKVFGPALGFLLGSFCSRLDHNLTMIDTIESSGEGGSINPEIVTVWWLGLVIISVPLMILSIPMYYLQVLTSSNKSSTADSISDFEDITYQAAEDHDVGGSRDFQTHVLTVCDLDVTSNRTCYSEIDSSSREVLQAKTSSGVHFTYNFGKNLILDKPIITTESIFHNRNGDNKPLNKEHWTTSCLIVNHFGGLESTSLTNEDPPYHRSSITSTSTTTSSSLPPPPPSTLSSSSMRQSSTMNLSNSLSRLIKNKLLLLRSLSAILHILPVAGFYTFLPKYLIEQYRIALSSANAISGLAGILFVGIGAFVGGTIIRLFNINSKFMTRWIATSALLYACGMLILMNLGCPENRIVHLESSDFLYTDCMMNCKCSSKIYNPVCANGTTYISPCLAGCKHYSSTKDGIIYDECGCSKWSIILPSDQVNTSSSFLESLATDRDHSTADQSTHLNLNAATQGHCIHDCDNLKWYIIVFSLFTFIHATCEVGSMMFNLRCVKSADRTLALGFITFTTSLLGTIPCSVIYGTVIDLTCVHWDTLLTAFQDENGHVSESNGACRAYRNDTFRYYLHGFTAFVMFLAFIVDYIISLKAKEVDFYDQIESKKEDATLALKKSSETI